MATAGQKRGEFGSGRVKSNLQPDPYLSRFLTPPLHSRCLPSLFVYSINLFISICFTNTTHLFFLFLAHLQKRREILKIGVIWFQNKNNDYTSNLKTKMIKSNFLRKPFPPSNGPFSNKCMFGSKKHKEKFRTRLSYSRQLNAVYELYDKNCNPANNMILIFAQWVENNRCVIYTMHLNCMNHTHCKKAINCFNSVSNRIVVSEKFFISCRAWHSNLQRH